MYETLNKNWSEKNEDLSSLQRMELALVHPDPSGKDLQMYANGNQQTAISARKTVMLSR